MTHRTVIAFALALGTTTVAGAVERPAPPPASAPLPPAPPPRVTGPVRRVDAVVRVVLYSPDARPDGLLLQDGTVVRFPPHTVTDPAALRIGARITATGPSVQTPGGTMLVDARLATAEGKALTADVPPPGPLPPR